MNRRTHDIDLQDKHGKPIAFRLTLHATNWPSHITPTPLVYVIAVLTDGCDAGLGESGDRDLLLRADGKSGILTPSNTGLSAPPNAGLLMYLIPPEAFELLVTATTVDGRVCGREFVLTEGQRRLLREFAEQMAK